LDKEDGTVYSYEFGEHEPQPKGKRYMGKVFVLVNRQSHSQSTVAAAQVQDYGFATIVGEETGESPSLLASVFYFSLPHTGITIQVSKGYSVRVNGNREEKGVIPDILIRDHLLDEKDEVLEGLFERLVVDE
jgi:C-terminal processing protease CtpA/Prc